MASPTPRTRSVSPPRPAPPEATPDPAHDPARSGGGPVHAHDHLHGHDHLQGTPGPGQTLTLDERMAAAESLCSSVGARFTPIRREVYRALAEDLQPVVAYDLLARLTARTGRRLAPPTIYRALDFLLDIGLVHRLESGNAWLACSHPGPAHDGVYLVCEDCGTTREIEVPAAVASLRQAAAATGFATKRMVIELAGVCGDCRPGGA